MSFRRKKPKNFNIHTRNAQKARNTMHIPGNSTSDYLIEERDSNWLRRSTSWRGYERKGENPITKIAV